MILYRRDAEFSQRNAEKNKESSQLSAINPRLGGKILSNFDYRLLGLNNYSG